jgi:hypothetical protein
MIEDFITRDRFYKNINKKNVKLNKYKNMIYYITLEVKLSRVLILIYLIRNIAIPYRRK